jgi:hypothetical protein
LNLTLLNVFPESEIPGRHFSPGMGKENRNFFFDSGKNSANYWLKLDKKEIGLVYLSLGTLKAELNSSKKK